LVIPLSTVLLKKLTFTQLANELYAFYGTQSLLLYSEEPATSPYLKLAENFKLQIVYKLNNNLLAKKKATI
jgi:hypothetical protein